MMRYHDEEWGLPVHDDRRHHEFLILDAFQAGLSWAIILKKREGFRAAFADFDPERVARFTPARVQKILKDPWIIRNKLKVACAVTNARAFLRIQEEFGTFDQFIWQFTRGETIQNRRRSLKEVPPRTRESDAMSKALIERGFKFAGSTICYAYMQGAGMVNDHVVSCFRHAQLK
ncbi:MAG: DNA-3-methyladenine glycosylase I [Gemmatimonadetes bacterium]|nr:DNA-3-methyladenine glycosylase I [Gemmatimonadota bacterium]